MANVAFIGLGTMGYHMAGHLASSGHDTCVYNRTASKAQAWIQEYKNKLATSPKDASIGRDFVFICVGNDDDLREVVLGPNGVIHGLKPGAIVIDHTTTSASVAQEIGAALDAKGIFFLDAPVSGGESGAKKGQLTIMVGGNNDAFLQAKPIMAPYTCFIENMGTQGNGQLSKMVNQICLTGILQGLAEGIHFAQNANLDLDKLFATLARGAAQSWQMDNRAKTMAKGEYNFGFAVDWLRKDLNIALDEARVNGSNLPVTALVDQFYAQLQALGANRSDTSSLLMKLNLKK